MIQRIFANVDQNRKRKLIVLVVGIVVLALALTTLGTFWYIKQTERTKAARKQCEIKVAQVMQANNLWKQLIANKVILGLTKDNSSDAKKLARIISEKVPDYVACTASSPEELGSQSAQALASYDWYLNRAEKVRTLSVALLNKNKDKDKGTNKDTSKEEEKTKEETKEVQQATNNVIRKSNVVPQRRQSAPGNAKPGEGKDKKPDAKKPDGKKPDAKKPDGKKPDAKKPDAKKPDAKKPNDADNKTNNADKKGKPGEQGESKPSAGQQDPLDIIDKNSPSPNEPTKPGVTPPPSNPSKPGNSGSDAFVDGVGPITNIIGK